MTKTFLKDYMPAIYDITHTFLDFHIFSLERVRVTAFLLGERRDGEPAGVPLKLHGENLVLKEIMLDGVLLDREAYELTEEGLTIKDPPALWELRTVVELNPLANVSLQGMFVSGDVICTQNEAEGFRRMTYFLDRPDVRSIFTIRLRAAQASFPVLLAGGEVAASDDFIKGAGPLSLAEGEHAVLYRDAFPKPAYLVAIVAGAFAKVERLTQRADGKDVTLELYVDAADRHRGDFALGVLARAMKWDEVTFDLSYDLSVYRIVAVQSFNFGAMENRGLNIFNAALILADKDVATDEDYQRIETVVAHEYFHHWSGNRVTLRDWFQLTFKEGLTVYRDQEFTSDQHSRSVKRIEDMMLIRSRQFREDAGPLAHPLRPETYEKIDNFYTSTIYEKGAEVVRMLSVMLRRDVFHSLITSFLKDFDGAAVTIEDFLAYCEQAYAQVLKKRGDTTQAGEDPLLVLTAGHWKQFALWYSTKGTPVVGVSEYYDESRKVFSWTCTQKILNNKNALPLLIPIKWALINTLTKETFAQGVDLFRKEQETYEVSGVKTRPVLSFARDFSAPLRIEREISFSEVLLAAKSETDPVMAWDFLQQLFVRFFDHYQKRYDKGLSASVSGSKNFNDLVTRTDAEEFWTLLSKPVNETKDFAYAAKCLTPPDTSFLFNEMKPLDFDIMKSFQQAWSHACEEELSSVVEKRYQTLKSSETSATRVFKHALLRLLVQADKSFLELARELYQTSTNMSDQLAAFNLLVRYGDDELREVYVQDFYEKWNNVPLVMNKWLATQSLAEDEHVFARLAALEKNNVYQEKEPNKVYALWGTFALRNIYAFNDDSGQGYRLLAAVLVRLDRINPSVSARLLTAYQHVKILPPSRRKHAEAVLQQLRAELVSENAQEVIQNFIDV